MIIFPCREPAEQPRIGNSPSINTDTTTTTLHSPPKVGGHCFFFFFFFFTLVGDTTATSTSELGFDFIPISKGVVFQQQQCCTFIASPCKDDSKVCTEFEVMIYRLWWWWCSVIYVMNNGEREREKNGKCK